MPGWVFLITSTQGIIAGGMMLHEATIVPVFSGVPTRITMKNSSEIEFPSTWDVRLWLKRQMHIPIQKACPFISLLMLRVID